MEIAASETANDGGFEIDGWTGTAGGIGLSLHPQPTIRVGGPFEEEREQEEKAREEEEEEQER